MGRVSLKLENTPGDLDVRVSSTVTGLSPSIFPTLPARYMNYYIVELQIQRKLSRDG